MERFIFLTMDVQEWEEQVGLERFDFRAREEASRGYF